MSPLPWADTGLAHRIRAILAPTERCANTLCGKALDVTNMLVDTRGYTYCDEGCADDDSYAAEQARIKAGRDLGLDVTNRPGRRPADIHFPMRRI